MAERDLSDAALELEIRRLVRDGNLIGAIKRRREATGEDLKTAKAYVDAMREGVNPTSRPPAPRDPTVDELIRTSAGFIEAVKRVREATGAGLKDAADRVRAVAERDGLAEEWRRTQPPSTLPKAVFFVVVVALLLIVLMILGR
jgi:ribosomal protein L7/L12